MTAPEFLLDDLRGARHRRAGFGAATASRTLVDILSHYLLRAHCRAGASCWWWMRRRTSSPDVLEQVRLLTNLETDDAEAAADHPHRPAGAARRCSAARAAPARAAHHRPLPPRIRCRATRPLAYVRHRLRVAGAANARLFTPGRAARASSASRAACRASSTSSRTVRCWVRTRLRSAPIANGALVRRAASEVTIGRGGRSRPGSAGLRPAAPRRAQPSPGFVLWRCLARELDGAESAGRRREQARRQTKLTCRRRACSCAAASCARRSQGAGCRVDDRHGRRVRHRCSRCGARRSCRHSVPRLRPGA